MRRDPTQPYFAPRPRRSSARAFDALKNEWFARRHERISAECGFTPKELTIELPRAPNLPSAAMREVPRQSPRCLLAPTKET